MTPAEIQKVLAVPGARYDADRDEIAGSPDAQYAAAKALGQIEVVVGRLAALKKAAVPPPPLNLRDYQVDGMKRLLLIQSQSGGALLSDDMGLGKTRQALAVAHYRGGLTVVVCPAAVREQWLTEALLVDTTAQAMRSGKDTVRLACKTVITSYELAEGVLEELLDTQARTPTTLILDEAHRIKGRGKKTAKGNRTLVRKLEEACALSTYRLALTGTPIWSRPRDLYGILTMVVGRRFGSSYEFDVRYCGGKAGEFGFENKGATNLDELRQRVAFYTVRRTKAEVLKELPPLTRMFRWVEASKEGSAAFLDVVGGHSRSAQGVSHALRATLEAKIPATVEACVEAGRFVCLTWLKEHAARIAEECTEAGVPTCCVTGDESPQLRASVIDWAEKNDHSVVGTLGALSTGVNLQRIASTGIMHALSWVPAELLQAEARIHRMGQTKGVVWTYVVMKDSMDEHLCNTLVRRLDEWAAAMPNTKGDGSGVMRNDLADGFRGTDGALLKALFADLQGADDGGE